MGEVDGAGNAGQAAENIFYQCINVACPMPQHAMGAWLSRTPEAGGAGI